MTLPITGINEQFNAVYFTAGPTEKDGIVIHWWGTPVGQSIQSVRDTFQGGGRQASAHFGATDGEVDCYVNPDDIAWANGNWAANLSKVSIECNPRQSDGDYYAAAWTIAYVRSIYGDLPLSRHRDYYATECCGDYDLERLDALAYEIAAGGSIDPEQTPTPGNPVAVAPSVPAAESKSINQLANEVIDGAYGTGDDRRRALGGQYDAVQAEVNRILTGQPNPQPSISALVDAVLRGEYGNGDQRITALGVNYQAVQDEINRRAGVGVAAAPAPAPAPSIDDLVRRTLAGEFGNGDERIANLGGAYQAVQDRINGGGSGGVDINNLVERTLAGEFGNGDDRIAALGGAYQAVQDEINRRYS
jgi:N-acetylmuramoyl-L-alanine amidase